MRKILRALEKVKEVITVILVVIMVAILTVEFGRPINKIVNHRDVMVTVTDKTVKNSNGDGKYLVYTKDEKGEIEVYEITDSLFSGRFDSSDDYAEIEVGKTYRFDVAGSRIKLLSWYPNIYEIEEIYE